MSRARALWGATVALGASSLGCLDDWAYHPPRATVDVVDATDTVGDIAHEVSADVLPDATVDAPMEAAIDALMDASVDSPVDAIDAPVDTALADRTMDLAEDVALDAPADICAGDACAAAGPRLRWPMSASRVTSQRPTLRWHPGGAAMTRVEVCRDRACGTVVHTMDVAGDRAQPTTALPAGVYFWRASSLVGGTAGERSATWEFFVGERSVGDSATGCVPDFNGDGFADLAVGTPLGSPAQGHVYIYPGAMGGPAAAPTLDLAGPMGVLRDGGVDDGSRGQFGVAVACASDVNGDGFPDLAVGARNFEDTHGRAYVFLGGPSGLRADAMIILPSLDGIGSEFGSAVAGVGDVNGDGYGEVAVGAWDALAGSRVHVYRGGPAGTEAAAPVTLLGSALGGPIGGSIAGDDFNGDGYADLLLGNRGANALAWAWVFSGGPVGLSPSPTATLSNGLGLAGLKVVVASAGDVDGDGRADVVLGAASPETGGAGRAFVHPGGAMGVSLTARVTLTGGAAAGSSFGASVAGAGDVNGDGFADVVVGAPDHAGQTGRAAVYLGGATGPSATPLTVLAGTSGPVLFGASVAGAGDCDGDPFDDLVVGAPGQRIGRMEGVFLFRGEAAGVRAGPLSLTNPNPRAQEFGASVAMGWWGALWVSVGRRSGADAPTGRGARADRSTPPAPGNRNHRS